MGDRDRLSLVLKGNDDLDGTEDFLLSEAMSWADIGEQGRGDVMSAGRRTLDDLAGRGPLEICALGDKSTDDRLLPLGDERTDVEVRVRRADLQSVVARSHALDDFAINLALDQNARGGRTGLARILDARIDQEGQSTLEVGVGKHELR